MTAGWNFDIDTPMVFNDMGVEGIEYSEDYDLISTDAVTIIVREIEDGVEIIATDPKETSRGVVYNGYTPVKGVDYFTEEDVEELTEQIAEAITYTHNQMQASNVWDIVHNMGKMPSVTVVDSGDNMVFGEVQYISMNELVVSFSSAFSGKAYLN